MRRPSLPTICRLIAVLSVYGAVASIVSGRLSFLPAFAGFFLVTVWVGMQLPEDEQGQGEEG